MKKIISIFLMASVITMVSCVNEIEDRFDSPALERLENFRSECETLLISAEHGWLIEYFPSEKMESGGYVLTAKFGADGNVEIAGEMADDLGYDVARTVTSHYSVKTHTGVLLSFDTYNEYMHWLSDPDRFSGNELDGEFEFVFLRGDEDRMEFYGVHTGNKVFFTALKNETDGFEYIRNVQRMSDKVLPYLYLGFQWTTPGKTLKLELKEDCNCLFYYPDGKDRESKSYSFIYKSDGISFYEPVTLNGITACDFKWVEDGGYFKSSDGKDEAGNPVDVTLKGYWGEKFMHYDDLLGSYTLYYGADGTEEIKLVLKEKVRYKSYLLEGLSPWGELELTYSKIDGQLTLPDQVFAKDGEYSVRMCVMSSKNWVFSWGGGLGYLLDHDGNKDNPMFTFRCNNNNSDYDAILIRRFLNGTNMPYNYGSYTWIKGMRKD